MRELREDTSGRSEGWTPYPDRPKRIIRRRRRAPVPRAFRPLLTAQRQEVVDTILASLREDLEMEDVWPSDAEAMADRLWAAGYMIWPIDENWEPQ